MFHDIIEAAKALVSAAGTLQRLGNERRTKLAKYFDKISELLQGFADDTRQGKPSRGLCAELRECAKAIRDVTSPALRTDEVESLANELAAACKKWEELTRTGAPSIHSGGVRVGEIEDAAGRFRGFADVLRAR